MATKKAPDGPDDPILRALERGGSTDIEQVVLQVCRLLSYPKMRRQFPDLKVEDFDGLRKLAILDTFSDRTLAERSEILRHLIRREGRTGRRLECGENWIYHNRARDEYKAVLERVEKIAEVLAETGSMMEAAKVFEPVMVGESFDHALKSKGRDRQNAIAAFTDRTSAKKGREGEEGISIQLPPEFLENMAKAAALVRESSAPEKAISGRADAPALPAPDPDEWPGS